MSDESQSAMDPNSQFGYCDDGLSNSLELLVSQLFDDDNLDCAADTKGSTSCVSEVNVKDCVLGPDFKESVCGAGIREREAVTSDMEALSALLDKAKSDSSFDRVTHSVKEAISEKFVDLERSAAREREKLHSIRQNVLKCSGRMSGAKQKLQAVLARLEEAHPSIPRETRTALRKCVEEVTGSISDMEKAAQGLRNRELAQSKLVQSGASLASSEAERVLAEHKPNYVFLDHIVDFYFR